MTEFFTTFVGQQEKAKYSDKKYFLTQNMNRYWLLLSVLVVSLIKILSSFLHTCAQEVVFVLSSLTIYCENVDIYKYSCIGSINSSKVFSHKNVSYFQIVHINKW